MVDLVEEEEVEAPVGLRSPEMMETGRNPRLVMSVLNSESHEWRRRKAGYFEGQNSLLIN